MIRVAIWVPLRAVERRVSLSEPHATVVACWRPEPSLRVSFPPLNSDARVLVVGADGASLWGSDPGAPPLLSVSAETLVAKSVRGNLVIEQGEVPGALWPREYVLWEYRPMAPERVTALASMLMDLRGRTSP
jgi:hypothetical protein